MTCCDFCDTEADVAAHMARLRAEYESAAARVPLPAGWKLVPFGDPVPHAHRAYCQHNKFWLPARRQRSTMTPMFARPHGWDLLYATPTS